MDDTAKIFRYVIGGMFAVILAMTGYIASSLNSSIAAESHRIDRVADQIQAISSRLTILETEYNDTKGKP